MLNNRDKAFWGYALQIPEIFQKFVVGANLVFAPAAIKKSVWRREKGEHKVRLYNINANWIAIIT